MRLGGSRLTSAAREPHHPAVETVLARARARRRRSKRTLSGLTENPDHWGTVRSNSRSRMSGSSLAVTSRWVWSPSVRRSTPSSRSSSHPDSDRDVPNLRWMATDQGDTCEYRERCRIEEETAVLQVRLLGPKTRDRQTAGPVGRPGESGIPHPRAGAESMIDDVF